MWQDLRLGLEQLISLAFFATAFEVVYSHFVLKTTHLAPPAPEAFYARRRRTCSHRAVLIAVREKRPCIRAAELSETCGALPAPMEMNTRSR